MTTSIACILSASAFSVSGYAQDTLNNQPDTPNIAQNSHRSQTTQVSQNSQAHAKQQKNEPVTKTKTDADNQLDIALVALRLKQAVERGDIDPSVLEEYQKQTLSQLPSVSGSFAKPVMSAKNSSSNLDDVHINNSNQNNEVIANTSNSNNTSSGVTNSQVNHSSAWQDTVTSVIDNESSAAFDMPTAAQIEQSLAAVTQQQQAISFDEPVATLADKTPPIGYDAALDTATLPVPSNRQTLGLEDASDNVDINNTNNTTTATQQTAAQRPIEVSDSVDAGYVSTEKDLTKDPQQLDQLAATPSSDDAKLSANDITGERIDQAQNNNTNAVIDPDDYLPEYTVDNSAAQQAQATQNSMTTQQNNRPLARSGGNIFKKIYNRIFNGGGESLPKINANIYLQQDNPDSNQPPILVKADTDIQPANNIQAALEDLTAQSISDFTAVLPRLREEAIDAAQAVGYYDISLRFIKRSEEDIDVIIERLGEPVTVATRVVDIRGEGAELPEFKEIQKNSLPLEGDVFNQGAYKNTKFAIESASSRHGYFDAEWLNKSVDVILPDNTADISLIYNTRDGYDFGDVIFFTLDKETGELTQDPDKLPVRLDLLKQLYVFRKGDSYYQPFIAKFTNDLAATQYFNTINVDVVTPPDGSSNAVLTFDNNSHATSSSDDDAAQRDTKDTSESQANTNGDSGNESTDAAAQSIFEQLQQTDLIDNDNAVEAATSADATETAPIEFAVDEETSDKLQAIKNKANRLLMLPDDRVLDGTPQQAKSVLGRISNAISSLAKKILPDEEDPFSDIDNIPETQPNLAGRITPEEVQKTKSVPLYVFVMADKPKDVQLGIGYGTDTGVHAVASFDNNLINRNGYQAGVSTSLSEINQTVGFHARRPWKHPLNDTLAANLQFQQEKLNQGEGSFDLTTQTMQAGIARNIIKESGWNRNYTLRYRLDRLESGIEGVEREKLPSPFNRNNASFDQQALLLGYSLNKTVADNVTNPTQGHRQYYSIEAGSKQLVTETNMAILRAGGNIIYSFGDGKKHQVIGSIDTGYIWADDFNEVPFKLRFFAGGDRSLRGYDYDSLSAMQNGYTVGGQILALGSVEYNYEFKPGFRAAVFTDLGNAYDKDFKTDTKVGVGTGIRWASPVGLVRLDVAAGVLEDDVPVRLYFFIGSPLQ
ncbi:autotransporter assembly complex protein TamA [Psychrobacter sp. I-STPA10]|uniref:autotransporter assembly complex protein TamA n=1 Tax=Psychrobacter sp. I-STPA10 TaxID=2585769 RepID=UPI001E3F0656|nr:BamA/TamA family outer membrane protein [Psychrobacter sp. I-STPA10]